jgi:signal transduction histidine kinase
MARLVWYFVFLLLMGVANFSSAQKVGSPYLAATIHSPYEISQKQINQLENLCDSLYEVGKTDSSLLTPLLELVNKYISFNPIKGMERAVWGSQLAEKQQLWGMASLFHTARGNILRYRGYRDLALDAYIKSYAYREKQDNPDLHVFGLVDIGNIYYDQADYAKAFEYYQLAFDSAIAKKYDYGQSVVLNNFGIIHRDLGAWELAEKFFLRSAQVRLKAGFYGLTAHSKNYIAGLRYREGRFAEGLVLTNDIIDTMQKYGMYSELADIYCSKARFLQALQRSQEADEALGQSWEILMRYNMLDRLEFHYLIQAEIAISRKQLDRAKMIIDKVIEQARSIDNLQGEIRAYDMLYRMYKNANKPQLALEALEKYHGARDNVKKQEVDRKLLSMENNLILQRQQRELDLQKASLQQREQLLAAQQAQNRLLLLVVLISWAGISIIATVLMKQRRTNKELLASQQLIEAQNKQMAKQNEELKYANEIAAKHLRAKTDFMSHMSHEIRTPMNSIMGLTELLQEEVKDKEALDKLQSIRYSADILLVIINDILDLASIEEGKIHLEHVSVSIRQIVHEISNLIIPKLAPKGIKLNIELPNDLPDFVSTDPTRLYQILLNLLGNAAKFTERGEIHLVVRTLHRTDKQCELEFEVRDTGPGIKQEVLPSIFDSFSQGGSDIHKKFGGTGLGLTITKKLVELLRGNIGVQSVYGEGSTFTVRLQLPISGVPVASDLVTAASSLKDLEGLNILYVEDNLMNQKVMGLLLKPYQLNLRFANNGEDGLAALSKSPTDLVLMDLRMPVLDGFEATVKIRSGEAGNKIKSIPIIGVTADAFDDSTRRALDLGMNDILVKPLAKEKLLQMLLKYSQLLKEGKKLKTRQ